MEKQLFELSTVLDSIEDWLKSEYPEFHKSLNAAADISDLEALLNLLEGEAETPAEFLDLYRRYDGQSAEYENGDDDQAAKIFDNFYFMPLQGVDGVLMEYESFEDSDYSGGASEGPVKRMYYNRLWLPFAKDFGGNFIGVDLDPPKGGSFGQVIRFGCDETPTVLAASLSEYFADKINELSIPMKAVNGKAKKASKIRSKDKGARVSSSENETPESIEKAGELLNNEADSKVVSIFSARSARNRVQPELKDDQKPVKQGLETGSGERKRGKTSDSSPEETKNSLGKLENLAKKVLRDPSLLEDGLSHLLSCLESESESTRITAMEQISEISSKEYFLKNDLELDLSLRIFALLKEAGAKIKGCLKIGSSKEQAEALRSLAELQFEDALDEMIKCLENPAVSQDAAWAIGKFETKAAHAEKALLIALKIKGSEEAALIALEKTGAVLDSDDNSLEPFVKSKDASIAATSCRLLARNQKLAARYVEAVIPHLFDTRGRLQDAAIDALAASKHQRALETLKSAMPRIRGTHIAARLAEFDEEACPEAIQRLLEDGGARALYSLGNSQALIKLLDHKDWSTRQSAIEYLLMMPDFDFEIADKALIRNFGKQMNSAVYESLNHYLSNIDEKRANYLQELLLSGTPGPEFGYANFLALVNRAPKLIREPILKKLALEAKSETIRDSARKLIEKNN